MSRELQRRVGRLEAVQPAEEIEISDIELARRLGFVLARAENGINVEAAQNIAELLGLDWPDWRAGLAEDAEIRKSAEKQFEKAESRSVEHRPWWL